MERYDNYLKALCDNDEQSIQLDQQNHKVVDNLCY